MNDIRRDFLIERYSLIAEGRGKRPLELEKANSRKGGSSFEIDKKCFFCLGNESLTPPTIDQAPEKGKWALRVFRNKFPALVPPLGDHEIIVDTNSHRANLHDLCAEEIVEVFKMYERRRKTLEKAYKYAAVFKNVGAEGGASLAHSHTQIIAGPLIPPIVDMERSASESYYSKWHRCPWCDELEGRSEGKGGKKNASSRIPYRTKHTVAIAANAPRFSYELWVMPKRHVPNFSELSRSEALDFCEVFKSALEKAYIVKSAYNVVLHHSPRGCEKHYHFHVEILPRVATHAGYEVGEGAFIVDTSPENAAKFYRGDRA